MLLKTKDGIFYPTMLMTANGLCDVKCLNCRATAKERRIGAQSVPHPGMAFEDLCPSGRPTRRPFRPVLGPPVELDWGVSAGVAPAGSRYEQSWNIL